MVLLIDDDNRLDLTCLDSEYLENRQQSIGRDGAAEEALRENREGRSLPAPQTILSPRTIWHLRVT